MDHLVGMSALFRSIGIWCVHYLNPVKDDRAKLPKGSWEGLIRLWRVEMNPRERRISAIGSLEAPGVVNSLQLMSMPRGMDARWSDAGQVLCIAGSGGELRSGRWVRVAASSAGLVYII